MATEPMMIHCCHQRTRSLPLTEETAVPSPFASPHMPSNSLYKNILLNSNSTQTGLSASNSSIPVLSGKSQCHCASSHRAMASEFICSVSTNQFNEYHHQSCHYHQQSSKYHQCIASRINNNNLHLANSQRFSQCSHGNLPLIGHKNEPILNESILRMLIGNKNMTNSMDSIAEDQILSTAQPDDVIAPIATVAMIISETKHDTMGNCAMTSSSSAINGGGVPAMAAAVSGGGGRSRNTSNSTRSMYFDYKFYCIFSFTYLVLFSYKL